MSKSKDIGIDFYMPAEPPTFEEAFNKGGSLEDGVSGRTPINQDFPVEGSERMNKRYRDGSNRIYRDDDC